jgi:hypothetical protein
MSIKSILHKPTSNLLDLDLSEVENDDQLRELINRRLDGADSWLPNGSIGKEEVENGLIDHFKLWGSMLSGSEFLNRFLMAQEDEEYVTPPERYLRQYPAKFTLSLHSVGTLLDAFREEDDLQYPEVLTIWEEPYNTVADLETSDMAQQAEMDALPKDLTAWKGIVGKLADVLGDINSDELLVSSVEPSIPVVCTDVMDQLIALDYGQSKQRKARVFLEMLCRLALVTRVFLKVSQLFVLDLTFDIDSDRKRMSLSHSIRY